MWPRWARRPGLTVLAFVALLPFAGACSDSSDSSDSSTSSTSASSPAPTSTVPPVATVGTLPEELAGTFAVVLEPADVIRDDQAGFWYLTLTPSKGYAFGRVPSDAGQNSGVLSVAEDTVTFSGERGEGPCEGAGTYRWTRRGDTLAFTVVDEDCAARAKQTAAKPYRRCPAEPATCVRPA